MPWLGSIWLATWFKASRIPCFILLIVADAHLRFKKMNIAFFAEVEYAWRIG
jgi:hypothetical protein